MTNGPMGATLYTGVTGDLQRRVWQHKNKLVPGFTSRYNLTHLVYYECFVHPDAAIAREKEIKAWRRSKKITLIESTNPRWEDLARAWYDLYKPTSVGEREIPRPAGENAALRDCVMREVGGQPFREWSGTTVVIEVSHPRVS